MKVEIDGVHELCKQLERVGNEAHDARVIAQEFASAATKEVKRLSDSIENLKSTSSIPGDFAPRLTSIEGRLKILEELLTEKSVATGKVKTSRLGASVAKFYGRSEK